MPAPLFKRFAPPTPAVTKENPPPTATPQKEKKSKKTADVVAAPADEAQEDVLMEDAPTPKTSKRPKKRKSEVVDEQNDHGEEASKKHKAVLSKFEKASKLAEARKDEAVEKAEEPEEDLHGKPSNCHTGLANNLVKTSSRCHSPHPCQNQSSLQHSRHCPHGSPSQSPSKPQKPLHSKSSVHNHTTLRDSKSWGSGMRLLYKQPCYPCCTMDSSNTLEISACPQRLVLGRPWLTSCPLSRR